MNLFFNLEILKQIPTIQIKIEEYLILHTKDEEGKKILWPFQINQNHFHTYPPTFTITYLLTIPFSRIPFYKSQVFFFVKADIASHKQHPCTIKSQWTPNSGVGYAVLNKRRVRSDKCLRTSISP